MNNQTKTPPRQKVFLENPYDLETVFESLSVSTDHDKELIFMDRLIANLRQTPNADLTDLCYNILREQGIIKLEKP